MHNHAADWLEQAQLAVLKHLNRALAQPTRLFVPDDGPADDVDCIGIGTPRPTVNLRKPRAVR